MFRRLTACLCLLALSSGAAVAQLEEPGLEPHVTLSWRRNAVSRHIVANIHWKSPGQTVVPRGAAWRYLARHTAPPADWAAPDFADAGWRTGAAPLGYGNGDEKTVVPYGPDPARKPLVTYFRRAFEVSSLDDVVGMRLDLVRDDGAVVYLNGQELLRSNLTTRDAIRHTTPAQRSAYRDGLRGEIRRLSARWLREGRNVLAVAVHQVRPDSSDIRFDLSLRLVRQLAPVEVPVRFGTLAETTDKTPDAFPRVARATSHGIPGLADRQIAHVELAPLEPGTVYRASAHVRGEWTPPIKFRTLPESGPLRLVVGGDSGVKQEVFALMTHGAKTSPDAAIVGGDITYANGELANGWRWDVYLDEWCKRMVTPDGLTIPGIWVIGNHEVVGSYDGDPARAPWYYNMFDQGGKSYFTLDLVGAVRLIVLDTGHTVSHEAQVPFLREALKGGQKFPWRWCAYHVPLWPSYRSLSVQQSSAGRGYWQPLFDQYRAQLCFEHHDHTLKRSKRMKGGRVVERGGTIFLGDGCWGVGSRRLRPKPYCAFQMARNHVWIVEMQPGKGWRARAVGLQGDDLRPEPLDAFPKTGWEAP